MDKYQTDKIHVNSLRKDAMAAYLNWKAFEAKEGNTSRTGYFLNEYRKAWQAYQKADMAQFLYEVEMIDVVAI